MATLYSDSIYINNDGFKMYSTEDRFETDKYTYSSSSGYKPLHAGFIVYHVPTALSYYNTSSHTWTREKGSGGPGTIYTLAFTSSDYTYVSSPEDDAIFYYAMFKGAQPSQYAPNRFTKHGWYLYSPYMMGGGHNWITGDSSICFDGDDECVLPTEEGVRVGTYKFFGDDFPYGMFCFVYILGKLSIPG